ncbi:MAG: carboxypeptidase-like regulatory domain-containing protein [Bacteroidia bacterium]|nr:carboxypeptidase-like regulatory domain-containing protein [Bacteroidia bacterium]
MKQQVLIGILAALLPLASSAQERVFQLSGMVISAASGDPVPYVTIQINHTRRGAICNQQGFFSVPVTLSDTVYFNHVGFHPSKLVMWKYYNEYQGDKSQYLYVVQYLREDTLTLKPIVIFPYDTPEELKTAVINMDRPINLAEDVARENLDPRTLHSIMASLPADGGERIVVARQMYYDYYHSQNLVPTVGFDPVMAARLLQYVVDKAKKRRDRGLNYWTE